MKRRPDTELNADNYDAWANADQEERDSGPMKQADESVLKKRVIIKARRKGRDGSGGMSDVSSNPFASSSVSSNPFAGASASSTVTAQKSPEIKNTFKFANSNSTTSPSKSKKPKIPISEYDDNTKDDKFTKAVGKLNQKFVKSVQDFVKSNSCVDLKPCFNSYNTHFMHIIETYATESVVQMIHTSGTRNLTDLCTKMKIDSQTTSPESAIKKHKQEEEPEKHAEPEKPKPSGFDFASASKPASTGFSFGVKKESSEEKSPSKPFTFAAPKPSVTTSNQPFTFPTAPQNKVVSPTKNETPQSKPAFTFSFGQKPAAPASGATFSTSKPKIDDTPSSSQPTTSTTNSNTDEPSDAVPEVQEKKFETENVVLEQRCKLYFNDNSGYKERGVGNFYIKKDPDTGKGQIIVRAENSSGTVLLNNIIYKNMPVKKQGKSNILLSCQCNPAIPKFDELTGKMISFLVKVKGEDMADRMVEELERFSQA